VVVADRAADAHPSTVAGLLKPAAPRPLLARVAAHEVVEALRSTSLNLLAFARVEALRVLEGVADFLDGVVDALDRADERPRRRAQAFEAVRQRVDLVVVASAREGGQLLDQVALPWRRRRGEQDKAALERGRDGLSPGDLRPPARLDADNLEPRAIA